MANYTVTITETLIASDKITIDVIGIAVLALILTSIITILVSTFLHLLHNNKEIRYVHNFIFSDINFLLYNFIHEKIGPHFRS